jgi:hypothetical protein
LRSHPPVCDGPRSPLGQESARTAWKQVWQAVVRHFRDGHTETWWATELSLDGYGPALRATGGAPGRVGDGGASETGRGRARIREPRGGRGGAINRRRTLLHTPIDGIILIVYAWNSRRVHHRPVARAVATSCTRHLGLWVGSTMRRCAAVVASVRTLERAGDTLTDREEQRER